MCLVGEAVTEHARIDNLPGRVAMIISVVNFSGVSDAEVQTVIGAVNRQIADDFEPYWSMGARLRLEGRSGKQPTPQTPPELRGDAIIYLSDQIDVAGALGYHDANNNGIPYGFVLMDLSAQLGEPWSVTLSHEALELIGDANVNQFAAGPHPDPSQSGRIVFHWYEMCDAVQAEAYERDGIAVSNFLLPLYFTIGDEPGSRNDFLGSGVPSFGVDPGGYIGFFDPLLQDMETWTADARGRSRLLTKSTSGRARRAIRYRQLATTRFATKLAPPSRDTGVPQTPGQASAADPSGIVVKVMKVG
jgi:hypothetical protein